MDGKLKKINCGDPATTLGSMALDEQVDLKESVAVLRHKIVEWDTPVHALSGMTSVGENCLKVVSKICELRIH